MLSILDTPSNQQQNPAEKYFFNRSNGKSGAHPNFIYITAKILFRIFYETIFPVVFFSTLLLSNDTHPRFFLEKKSKKLLQFYVFLSDEL
jgi:hypothetical protein